MTEGSGRMAEEAAEAAAARTSRAARPEGTVPGGGGKPEETRGAADAEAVELRCRGVAVASWRAGADVPPDLSPRPYLHPVRTLGGTVVTEVYPADHPHHLGVGVAVPDIDGTSFWGGTTFVRDRGPVLLDNHGRQEHRAWTRAGESRRTERVAWLNRTGAELCEEVRETAAVDLDARAWALCLRSRLRNTSGRELEVNSPATKGRPGAGYGGYFWRAPKEAEPPRCLGPEQEGETALHGSRSPWLALFGGSSPDTRWTLVFAAVGPERDPWFLRAREYPGVGAALVWDTPLRFAQDAEIDRHVVTVVADGHLSPSEEIPVLVARAEAAAAAD
ncbi:PmoA family protein [Streptomonospora sp. S1-112]|uniref:PmoA family protein n=1 Tax=Streptomonospora mangrovi TaxID=2883123 RepID=A0A9X3NR99_9ACTN|nr:PmoA family protein [Streptomonospora mangrovi]MDA0566943.1 PmoA family protein [Streptomonospora mangrovi]